MSNQIEFFDYEIDGVEAYSAALAEASFELSQLEPGKLQGHHTRIRTPEFEISWIKTNLGLRGLGHTSSDAWTISLVLNAETRSLQHGIDVETGSLVLHGPGAVHDGVYGRGFSVVCFGVPRQVFEQRVQREFPDLKDLLDKQWKVYAASELETSKLITTFREAVELLRSDHSIRHSAVAFNSMADELLYDYLLTLLEANQVSGNDKVSSATNIIQTAERSLNDSQDHTWAIGDLCQTLGVSRRTLSRAFEQTVGIGPATYLRRIRLNLARNNIRNGYGNEQTITEIATNLGFWHLGRFAEQYREMFGESPRDTRLRFAAKSEV